MGSEASSGKSAMRPLRRRESVGRAYWANIGRTAEGFFGVDAREEEVEAADGDGERERWEERRARTSTEVRMMLVAGQVRA